MSSILIVEDNKTEADALSLRLKAVGYKVFVGYNGTEGKRLAVQVKPNLALLGISLPEGGGLGVAQFIREHKDISLTAIAFLTSCLSPIAKEAAMEYYPIAFLEKTVDFNETVGLIKGMVWNESMDRMIKKHKNVLDRLK